MKALRSIALSVALTSALPVLADDTAEVADAALTEREAIRITQELLAAARTHSLDDDFITSWVDTGTTDLSRARWLHAFRPFGPLEITLGTARGVAQVAHGPEYVRVVLDSAPPVSIVLHDQLGRLRIRNMEVTSCSHCTEPQRFVEDLLAGVRRTGTLGDRLQPDLELVSDDPGEMGTRWESWSAAQEVRLRADQSIAAALAGATVLGADEDQVQIRYADGAEDNLRVVPTARGWAISYDELAASSPLRLSTLESRRWRRLSERQEVAVATWTPSWQPLYRGAARIVGHNVLSGTFDPTDDTLLLSVLDRDVPWGGFFHVDAGARSVDGRWLVPVPDFGEGREVGSQALTWKTAYNTHSATLAAFGRVWRLERSPDLSTGSVSDLGRLRGPQALTIDPIGQVWWIGADAHIHSSSAYAFPTDAGPVVALRVEGDRAEAIGADGWLRAWRAGILEAEVEACPSGAAAASSRPSDGTWLVVCGPESTVSFALVHEPGRVVEPWGDIGATVGVAAWSSLGRRFLVPAPPEVDASFLVWDELTGMPELALGDRPLVSATFSADDEQLLAVDTQGDAVLWNLPLARRMYRVRTWTP